MKNIHQLFTIVLIALLGFSFSSCRKFLEIGSPQTEIGTDEVFNTNAVATSAVLSIYGDMNASSNAFSVKLSSLLGQAADELQTVERVPQSNYFTNSLLPTTQNDDFWTPCYKHIYYANLAIGNLRVARNVTPQVKQQLLGEAIFIRAFMHFYLVNLFGDIPYLTATDYKETNNVVRMPTSKVYELIIQDLKMAKSYLKDNFPDPNNNLPTSQERIRANKSAAGALLAKTYLHLQDWNNAKLEADSIIASPNYELLPNIDQVFLKNSKETIWALQSSNVSNPNTFEAGKYLLKGAPSLFGQAVTLSSNFYETAFEPSDKRKSNWVGSYTSTVPAGTWYYPYKYKASGTTGAALEYAVVFRLAEIYLIRAEALAELDQGSTAVADLNKIRKRARATDGALPDYPENIAKADLLNAILKERRVELFAECGHRWLDLKRTGLADGILSPVKGVNWQTMDLLFPIPEEQLIFDPNMSGQQNPGYNK